MYREFSTETENLALGVLVAMSFSDLQILFGPFFCRWYRSRPYTLADLVVTDPADRHQYHSRMLRSGKKYLQVSLRWGKFQTMLDRICREFSLNRYVLSDWLHLHIPQCDGILRFLIISSVQLSLPGACCFFSKGELLNSWSFTS